MAAAVLPSGDRERAAALDERAMRGEGGSGGGAREPAIGVAGVLRLTRPSGDGVLGDPEVACPAYA